MHTLRLCTQVQKMHTYVSTSKTVHGHMHMTLKTAVSLFFVLIIKRSKLQLTLVSFLVVFWKAQNIDSFF